MSKAAIIRFADTVLQHFPPYRWDEEQEKAWAATMVRELNGFSDAVIERASRELVRTRRKEKTPLVAECIEACNEAKRWTDSETNKGKLPLEIAATAHADWTADRLRLATDLTCNPKDPMCVQAAREGWNGGLWHFARTNGRLPQPGREIDGLKREAKEFDAAYDRCVKGGWDQAAGLENIGAGMLRKRRELAAKAGVICSAHAGDARSQPLMLKLRQDAGQAVSLEAPTHGRRRQRNLRRAH